MRHTTVRLLILALILTQCVGFVFAQNTGNSEHWIATWAASAQQPPAAGAGPRGPAPGAAYRQRIERAHTQGIKVIGCTLTPYVGAAYASDAGEAARSAVNAWIRTPGNFDAFVDFEAATRDPANPKQFLKAFNNTDNLHPNDAGYKAMADSVDLSIFTRR